MTCAATHAQRMSLVAGASDAYRTSQVDDLATVLYGMRLALVLSWLQDLSGEAHKTVELLQFIHDLLERARPLLQLPWITQTLARLAQIISLLLRRNDSVRVE